MADTSGLPPEGWYPDRPNATRLRHWSGTAWTNEFRPIEQSEPEPTPALVPSLAREPLVAAAEPEPVRRVVEPAPAEPVAVVEPPATEPVAAPEPVAATAPEPPARAEPEPVVPDPVAAEPEPARYVPRRQAWQESFAAPASPSATSQTLAGWLFAASPLWVAGLLVVGTSALSILNPYLVQGALLLVAFALTVLLVRLDIRRLTDRGYRAPSAWWVLLPFLYFFVRMLRVGLRGMGMLVAYFLSTVAVGGLLYLAVGNPGLLAALGPSVPADSSSVPTPVATLGAQERANLLTPDGVEAKLRLDLAPTWDVGAVDCVPFPSTERGATTTCVVVLDGVSYNAGLQVTPDEADKAFVLTGMLPVAR